VGPGAGNRDESVTGFHHATVGRKPADRDGGEARIAGRIVGQKVTQSHRANYRVSLEVARMSRSAGGKSSRGSSPSSGANRAMLLRRVGMVYQPVVAKPGVSAAGGGSSSITSRR